MFLEPMASTSIRASSARPADVLVLADGTRFRLRPLGSEDRDGFAALFARLGPESRYRRFLSPKRELTPLELSDFTDIDHIRHAAFAAIDQRDGSIVGVGRYVHVADRAKVADLAIEVTDDLQNMGIATARSRHRSISSGAVDAARESGFAAVSANDHFLLQTPWLDGMTALAAVVDRSGAWSWRQRSRMSRCAVLYPWPRRSPRWMSCPMGG